MRLRITVEGQAYEVDVEVLPEDEKEIEPEPAFLLPEAFLRARPPSDTLPDDHLCRSPIAGVVIAVLAHSGQTIYQDEPVVVIEAMKMQSTIGAPMNGVVQTVQVVPGQKVKAGQVMLEVGAAKPLAMRQTA